MMDLETLAYTGPGEMTVTEVKVKVGSLVSQGKVVALYTENSQPNTVKRLKSTVMGRVVEVSVRKGETVTPGTTVLKLRGGCQHPTIMKDMCAECGADLRKIETTSDGGAKVAMVHSIPELKVSDTEARNIGEEDQQALLQGRKLVLLVDLDQTLIHTTNDDIPPNLKDVKHFQLYGSKSPWYHTRMRPGTAEFLQKISELYELHICTFGARLYAHTIAAFLDPDKKYFSHRILSRDECFDARSKTANMSALFPCGDTMVCIIDDREDVWNFAPNLVHVKPYHFFKHTGDINAPPGLSKKENDEKTGVDFEKIINKSQLNFKGKLPTKNSGKSNEDQESSSDEESEAEEEKPRRKRNDSIDMPLVENDNNNHENVQTEKEKSTETSSKDVNDDLEISDSDDSNSKPPDNSDAKKPPKEKKTEPQEVEIDDPDDYLLYLEDILKTVHKAYYDLYDQSKSDSAVPAPDLKTVIPYVKRKVLAGVVLVFSGVIPTQVAAERSKPFLLARSLGAVVRSAVDQETTHLVAARLGTAKVNDARKLGDKVSIVTPDWLWSCSERWERVSEELFTLTKTCPVTRKPPAHCSSPEIAFAQRCADIDINLDGNVFSRQPSVAEADPFLAFSTEDLAGMDKEVEDILSGDSDSDTDGEAGLEGDDVREDGSSSEDSLTGVSRGHKRKMNVNDNTEGEEEEEEDSNLETPTKKFISGEVGRLSDDSGDEGEEEEGDWSLMGAALEKELM